MREPTEFLKQKYSDPVRQMLLRDAASKRWREKPENKAKNRVASLKYKRRNRHLWHAHHLRDRYGMSVEQYDELLAKQNGLCAICKQPWNGRLQVDHCHETNSNRGLLCGHCNRGIGLFRENKQFLSAAIEYLQLFEGDR